MVKFLRRDAHRFSKFGKGKGKKAGWRKPKGRDNKMREKRKGYSAIVSIGYKGVKNEKEFVIINNLKELEKAKGKEIIIGKVGEKKKIEIVKKAKELKIELKNVKVSSFLKKVESKLKKKECKTPLKETKEKKNSEENKKWY